MKLKTEELFSTCCPMCAQAWPVREGLTVIGDYVFWEERPFQLPPYASRMFQYLYKKRGLYVSDESLVVHLYGMREEVPNLKILQVYGTRIRNAFRRTEAPFQLLRQRCAKEDYAGGGYTLIEVHSHDSATAECAKTFRPRPRLRSV